jgi:hypothetical protein
MNHPATHSAGCNVDPKDSLSNVNDRNKLNSVNNEGTVGTYLPSLVLFPLDCMSWVGTYAQRKLPVEMLREYQEAEARPGHCVHAETLFTAQHLVRIVRFTQS